MFRLMAAAALAAIAWTAPAHAEEHIVRMLNKGVDGIMVFEPGLLHIAPGDTVRFMPVDRGHNAETIAGMIPEGAAPFEGRLNEELVVSPETDGLYAIRCKPHYAMGMVMIIAVGDAAQTADFIGKRVPPRARQRFETYLNAL